MVEGSTAAAGVRIVSTRVIRPDGVPSAPPEVMHLTPWDLRMLTVDYIQKGLLLPKPRTAAAGRAPQLADSLASSFARALARFYPLAGSLAVAPAAAPSGGIVVSLRCDGEGAEFVHAVAPDVTVSDIADPVYIPSAVVWSLFPLNGLLNADAALDSRRPVLAAQVTELTDGVFVAMSLNHTVADGTTFWHLFNTWSEISRSGGGGGDGELIISTPPPVHRRWFLDTSPVPIPLPFAKLEDIIRRPEYPPVRECFFHFSAESLRALKAKANAEMAGTATPAATVSSLQSLLAHTWRAACRAQQLAPDRETRYVVLVGCRARVEGIAQGYVGNTVMNAVAKSTAGDVLTKGLGWVAWLLNRAVASFDEARVREELASWARNPSFMYLDPSSKNEDGGGGGSWMGTGSSPRFDVYGNDFGWGRPVGVRSGAGNKIDGKVTVY